MQDVLYAVQANLPSSWWGQTSAGTRNVDVELLVPEAARNARASVLTDDPPSPFVRCRCRMWRVSPDERGSRSIMTAGSDTSRSH